MQQFIVRKYSEWFDIVCTELASCAKAHDGDPGRFTVRRLTSGEYAHSIQ